MSKLYENSTEIEKMNFSLIFLLLGGLTIMYLVDAELDRRERKITTDYILKTKNFARNLSLIKGDK